MSFGGSAGKRVHHFGDFRMTAAIFGRARVAAAGRLGFGEAHADHGALAERNDDAAADQRFAVERSGTA